MIAFCDTFALACRCVVLVWGAFILIRNFIINRNAFKVKYKWILWAFILMGIFTSIWNLSIDFLPNMAFIYHSIICFFVFYGMYTEKEHKKIEFEMAFLLKYFIVFSTITSFIGILVALFKAQVSISGYYIGILRSRLIGIHTNSNLLALSNIISIISCDIINDKYIKGKFKSKLFSVPVLIISCIINFVSLFLSDSNASFLFIVIYSIVRFFYVLFSNYKETRISYIAKGSIFLVGFCILVVLGSFSLRDFFQNGISVIINDIHKIEEPIVDNDNEVIIINPNESSNREEISIGRENYDISSGRITLLKQGIKLFMVNPWIGIGRGNLVRFGEKYLENGLVFSDLHNGYLTILVSYGLLGFGIFMAFSFLTAFDMCSYLFKANLRCDSGVFSKLFSVCVAYCAYSLFEKTLLSEITFMVVFFWLILGYTISYMNNGYKYLK